MNTSSYPFDLHIRRLLLTGAECGMIQLNELTSYLIFSPLASTLFPFFSLNFILKLFKCICLLYVFYRYSGITHPRYCYAELIFCVVLFSFMHFSLLNFPPCCPGTLFQILFSFKILQFA